MGACCRFEVFRCCRAAALFNIPQHLLLHEGHAWNDPDYGSAFRQLKEEVGDALDKRWTLCLLLLIERARGEHSKWAKYIDVLPRRYDDPLWWSEEDLNILRGTPLEAAVEHYSRGLRDLHVWRARLCTLQRELGGTNVLEEEPGQWSISEEALRWAKSTVWSRAFNIKSLGANRKEGIALIPVLDMLDHNPQQHVAWHTGIEKNDNFQFLTKSAIRKGEQLYSNYGHKSNEELLLGYGFVLEPNTADFFSASLGLETHSAAGEERAAMLRSLLHRLGLQTKFFLTRTFPLPSTLLVAAAICLLPDAQAYSLFVTDSNSVSQEPAADASAGARSATDAQQGEITRAQNEQVMDLGVIEVQPAPLAATAVAAVPAAGSPAVRGGLQVTCPVAVHLQALLALKQQLRGKLAKLQGGSFQEDMQLAASAPPGSATHMALVYRAGQKEIAHAALGELAQQTSSLLSTAFTISLDDPLSTSGNAPETPSQPDGLFPGLVRECSAQSPWHWGLDVLQDCAPGQQLSRVPLAAGIIAGSRADLVLQLALMRVRRECAALSTPGAKESQPGHDFLDKAEPADSAFLDRLIQYLDVPFAASLIAGDTDSVCAFEALAGTPLGDLLEGEIEHLQEQYAAAAPSLRAVIGGTSNDSGTKGNGLMEAESHAPGGLNDELCPGLRHTTAMRALAWADAVVDSCGVSGPSGSDMAILPLSCALPKELRGVVVDLSWEQTAGEDALVLTAAVRLKAGLVLSHACLLRDSNFESVFLNWGPCCCAELQKSADTTSCAFEICIDPPHEHLNAAVCRNLLLATGIGRCHWLSATTSQEPLLAALVICCADEDSLLAMGGADLLRQQAARDGSAHSVEPEPTEVGSSGSSPDEQFRTQWAASEKFLTAVKNKHLMKAARRQLKSLLQDAWHRLYHYKVKDGQSKGDSHLDIFLKYRNTIREIVSHNLSMLKQHSKRPATESGSTDVKTRTRLA